MSSQYFIAEGILLTQITISNKITLLQRNKIMGLMNLLFSNCVISKLIHRNRFRFCAGSKNQCCQQGIHLFCNLFTMNRYGISEVGAVEPKGNKFAHHPLNRLRQFKWAASRGGGRSEGKNGGGRSPPPFFPSLRPPPPRRSVVSEHL